MSLKNPILFLAIFILFLFIVGCAGSFTFGSKKTEKEVDVRVGFTGLTLEFLKNTPPAKVFEGDTFPVIIRVRNTGAFSLDKDDKAILSLGVEKDYTKNVKLLQSGRVQQLGVNAASFNLEGRSKINTKGEEEVISYNIVAGKVDPQSEAHSSTVIAALCYPYNTILDSSVCIDTDVSGLRPGKKACKMQDLVFNNGQGAPVAITKIEVNMLPHIEQKKIIPQFLIFVENKGQGTVIKKDAYKEFCIKSDTSHENINIVYVNVYLSNTKLDCQLEAKQGELGHIKLKDKKDIIRCSLNEGTNSMQDSYLSPLRIELAYGYTQSILGNYFIQKATR